MAMTSAEINETIRKAKAGTPLADTAPSADKVAALDARIAVLEGGVV